MIPSIRLFVFTVLIFVVGLAPVRAAELLHYIEGGEHAEIIAEASGLKISDQDVVYVTSEEKGSLLTIIDGNIRATQLAPGMFKEQLPAGKLRPVPAEIARLS